ARPLDPGILPVDPADHPGQGYVLDPAEPVSDELALLRFYNRLNESGGSALLTAHRPVAAWPLGLADLASRLRAAPSVAIGAPDDALLGALLVKHLNDRQLEVSAGLVAYLVRRMERSFAEARRLVAELDALSLQRRRPITVALARRLVEQIREDQS
ncbi:MAG: HdaA/DnaA family protein, partial [Geminicoccaceae bacterium]